MRLMMINLIPHIIEGKINLRVLARNCGLNIDMLKEVLSYLESKNIAEIDENSVYFQKGGKILTAVSAVKMGSSVDEVSKVMNWKDFEEFTCFILSNNGYSVHQNFRLRHPRREIDILAIKDEKGLAIDCKHRYSTMGVSNISKVANAQIERVNELIKSEVKRRLNVSCVIPLIVTLYNEQIFFMNKVPIIPIDKFPHFLYELDGLLDMILIIK
ncbi:MAG: restriction endonuclease [Candidatus Methylarchaceae archaeon HK02M2]|nr:restriction endonuclease [Candidatus Methylarchaceae archaeon HK02M2]